MRQTYWCMCWRRYRRKNECKADIQTHCTANRLLNELTSQNKQRMAMCSIPDSQISRISIHFTNQDD